MSLSYIDHVAALPPHMRKAWAKYRREHLTDDADRDEIQEAWEEFAATVGRSEP